MKIKGCITRSIYGDRTVCVFVDGVRVFKEGNIYSLADAQGILKTAKQNIMNHTSHESLEGKIITVKFSNGFGKGKVIGCDYDIGITVIDPDNDRYILCLRGPSSTHAKNIPMEFDNYPELFDFIVNKIKEGYIVSQDIINFEGGRAGRNPSKSECAFGA